MSGGSLARSDQGGGRLADEVVVKVVMAERDQAHVDLAEAVAALRAFVKVRDDGEMLEYMDGTLTGLGYNAMYKARRIVARHDKEART